MLYSREDVGVQVHLAAVGEGHVPDAALEVRVSDGRDLVDHDLLRLEQLLVVPETRHSDGGSE